jgi:dimeric dUTPase (all-alpha-NTP-PPase superfamily)
MNRIKQMLVLQQQLNDATGGKGWEQGYTDKGKPIDWKRCIYLEAAELVDSYPWKHWKNISAEPDYDNIKIEIVDIWHFVMSEALRDYKINQNRDLDQLANDMTSLPDFKKFTTASQEISLDVFEQIAVVENLLKTLFTGADVLTLVNAFYKMSADLGVNLDELYKLYIGKNILNQFRQDHGYKEGHYIKNWHGVEDNVVMQNLLTQYPVISPDKLYQLLESEYSKN